MSSRFGSLPCWPAGKDPRADRPARSLQPRGRKAPPRAQRGARSWRRRRRFRARRSRVCRTWWRRRGTGGHPRHHEHFSSTLSACYLTLLPAAFLLGRVALDGLSHVVAGGRAAVLRHLVARPGAGFAGFRRAGRGRAASGGCCGTRGGPGRGTQPAGRARAAARAWPRCRRRGGGRGGAGRSRRASASVHRSAAAGSRSLGSGPAEDLLEEPDMCCSTIEAAQECLPGAVDFDLAAAQAPGRTTATSRVRGSRSPGSRSTASRIRVHLDDAAACRRGLPHAGPAGSRLRAAGPRPRPARCRTGLGRGDRMLTAGTDARSPDQRA